MREGVGEGRLFRFTDGNPIRCSFCGKEQRLVKKIIASEGAYICNECIVLCAAILTEEISNEMPAGGSFRVAVRRPDGSTDEVEVKNGAGFSLAGWCWKCGTLLAGYDIRECLHCGAPLGEEPPGTS